MRWPLTWFVVVVMMVMAKLVVGRDADVLGQHVSQSAGGSPAATAACGGGGRGGGWGGGGGGGGGSMDGPRYPVLHANAALPAGRGAAPAAAPSSILLLAIFPLVSLAVALPLTLWAWGRVWGGEKVKKKRRVTLNCWFLRYLMKKTSISEKWVFDITRYSGDTLLSRHRNPNKLVSRFCCNKKQKEITIHVSCWNMKLFKLQCVVFINKTINSLGYEVSITYKLGKCNIFQQHLLHTMYLFQHEFYFI